MIIISTATVAAEETMICCYRLPESGTANIDYSRVLLVADTQPIGSLPHYYQYTSKGINLTAPGVQYRLNTWVGFELLDAIQQYQDMTLYCTRTQGHSLSFRVGTINQVEFSYQPGGCQGDTLYDRTLRNVKRDK